MRWIFLENSKSWKIYKKKFRKNLDFVCMQKKKNSASLNCSFLFHGYVVSFCDWLRSRWKSKLWSTSQHYREVLVCIDESVSCFYPFYRRFKKMLKFQTKILLKKMEFCFCIYFKTLHMFWYKKDASSASWEVQLRAPWNAAYIIALWYWGLLETLRTSQHCRIEGSLKQFFLQWI